MASLWHAPGAPTFLPWSDALPPVRALDTEIQTSGVPSFQTSLIFINAHWKQVEMLSLVMLCRWDDVMSL